MTLLAAVVCHLLFGAAPQFQHDPCSMRIIFLIATQRDILAIDREIEMAQTMAKKFPKLSERCEKNILNNRSLQKELVSLRGRIISDMLKDLKTSPKGPRGRVSVRDAATSRLGR